MSWNPEPEATFARGLRDAFGDVSDAATLFCEWESERDRAASPRSVSLLREPMTLNDRILFLQIHPAKLVSDATAAVLCLYFLWRRDLSLAVVVGVIPPLIATGLVLGFADLEALKQSALGIYVKNYMTSAMQLLRVCGFLVMAVAAWKHAPLAMLAGLAVVAAVNLPGWSRSYSSRSSWQSIGSWRVFRRRCSTCSTR